MDRTLPRTPVVSPVSGPTPEPRHSVNYMSKRHPCLVNQSWTVVGKEREIEPPLGTPRPLSHQVR